MKMEQHRGLLLSFVAVQLLLMGAFHQSHHLHDLTSFLRLLIQDRSEVSPPGTSQQDVYSNLSQIHPVDVSEDDLPNCPIISPYINGPLKVMFPENLTMEKAVEKNPLRQQLHYAIYVVNQVNNTAFNRGKLRNVGFREAMQEENWDCVFFHDVNLLPEDDRNIYTCDIFPAHVSVAINKFNYKLPYQGYLGGVFALRPIHYLRINGFSNVYWNWDDEDDNIATRVKLSGMLLSRPHLLFGRYHMLEEGQDQSQKQSVWRLGLRAWIHQRWRHDGINSLGYRLLSKERHPLYTNLTVDINFQNPEAPVPNRGIWRLRESF
ncbi:beta-1,4-galactosyltransferase 3-like isoform X2 [Urocitellus parryii]